jgi:hypothetical protein
MVVLHDLRVDGTMGFRQTGSRVRSREERASGRFGAFSAPPRSKGAGGLSVTRRGRRWSEELFVQLEHRLLVNWRWVLDAAGESANAQQPERHAFVELREHLASSEQPHAGFGPAVAPVGDRHERRYRRVPRDVQLAAFGDRLVPQRGRKLTKVLFDLSSPTPTADPQRSFGAADRQLGAIGTPPARAVQQMELRSVHL